MIEVSNLTFGYRKKSVLFKNLNLSLGAGHIYGLLGKNGAGKSTLLKNLSGLAYPWEGSCKLNNYVAADRLPGFLQDVFLIPDELYIPSGTVRQFLNRTAPFYPAFDKTQFLKMLEDFEVALHEDLNGLSFGQQKKVMIAFGLAANTRLLLMDEPTNGLDIPSKIQFRKIIALALTEDRCIVISTHQVRDLDSLIDTVIILHENKIVLNKELDIIAERVRFTAAATVNAGQVLYSEPNSIGVNTISINDEQNYSKVELEMLFTAVTSGCQSIIDLLK